MSRILKRYAFSLISVLVIMTLLITACGDGDDDKETEPEQPVTQATDVPVEPTKESEPVVEEPSGEKVKIRWFVGLGTGSQPEHLEPQEAVVQRFNDTHDDIELILEIVDNAQAPDQLKTQVAAGNPPDIVGPVGQSGVNEFSGLFLDLQPYLDLIQYDFSDFDTDSIDAYRLEGEGLLGLPFAVFPSMIYYNRDLFDEAGLDYPPHVYGEPYADGDPWTVEKMEELAMLLTVDANGNDATSPDFDPDSIVQFGYHTQWTDPRGQAAALFGADNVIDADGNAVLSERWRTAFRWYYEGMHEKHFMPNNTYQNSDILAAGNPFDSGNVAMAHCHLWYTCCNTNVPNWDMAVVPSYNDQGDVTVKLHADTFRVFASSEHPEEAVEVLTWLTGEGAGELLQVYGGMPGRKSLQAEFFAGMDEKFPQGVDWQVAVDGLAYPDVPNHESNLPNYSKAYDRIGAFQTLYQSEASLDIDAELDALVSDLQTIFEGGDWEPEPVPVVEPEPEPDVAPSTGDKVQIRWFVGLGTGSQPEHLEPQEAVVQRFNDTHDNIELVLEIVDNAQAPDQLKTQVAAGNPPDIVGPVGQSGVNEFSGLFLDMGPYLDLIDYDFSDFDTDSIDAYRLEGEGLLGLPFAVFPSMIYYNRDLFDEAGLDYPPQQYGEPYADGDPWTVEKMEELAMLLTVDANGNDATSPDFDPDNIVQFGYHTQWTDPRGQAAALFGADNVIDADGNAMLSERWRTAFRWYYEGMHEKHFMPNNTYQNSDILAAGNPFDSGNVAMAHCHLWYTCCNTNVPNWDMAVVPSYNDQGDVTVKLHADTFRVFKSSEHPDEAIEVLIWLTGEGAGELLQVYGGMPGRKSLQAEFFAGMDEKFPQGVNWQVAIDGLAYPDIPNHESNLPNYSKAYDRIGAFQTLYQTEAGLDIDAELDTLVSDLQAIFDEEQ